MPFTSSNIEQRIIFSWFVHCTFHVCVNADIFVTFNVSVFSEKNRSNSNKDSHKVILPLSAAVALKICIQNNFNVTGYAGPPSHSTPAKISVEPYTFSSHREWTTKDTASYPRIWPLSQFSQNPQRCCHPQTTRSSLENMTYTFPSGGMGGF